MVLVEIIVTTEKVLIGPKAAKTTGLVSLSSGLTILQSLESLPRFVEYAYFVQNSTGATYLTGASKETVFWSVPELDCQVYL